MLRQRMFLVRMNTRIKNRIHALIEKYRIPTPGISDLFGKIGLSFLKKLQLPHPGNLLLKQDIELIEAINITIKDTEKEVMAILNEDERYNIARTLPGLGAILAGVVILEIDKIERFPIANKLLSYAGLVPTTYAS